MNLGWRKQMKYIGKGSKMWLMWWLVYQGVYTKHISNGSHQKYTSDRIHKFNKRLQASAGTLFMLWQWDSGTFRSSSPHPPQFTAEVHCYHSKLQTQLSVTSKKCVYGLLTSRDGFQSLGVSFHFQVSAQVNTVIRALTICWDSLPLLWQVQKSNAWLMWYDPKRTKWKGKGILGAPCWLRCIGRRTSVCLTGLHILSGRSSVCSHERPELQEEERVSK